MQNTELSAKERQQLLAVLRDLDETAPAEKRREMRRKVLLNMWIRKIGPSRRHAQSVALIRASVVNVSAQGVGLLCSQPLSKQDRLVLPLRFREGGGWLVLCQVRNCQTTPNGEFRIGARFLDRIEDADGDAKVPMKWVLSDG